MEQKHKPKPRPSAVTPQVTHPEAHEPEPEPEPELSTKDQLAHAIAEIAALKASLPFCCSPCYS